MATKNAFSRNWQRGKTLAESLKFALLNTVHSDVTFVVGTERKQIEAHKLILCIRSTVFDAMLTGPMSEQNNIVLPDVDPEIFHLFLQ